MVIVVVVTAVGYITANVLVVHAISSLMGYNEAIVPRLKNFMNTEWWLWI